MNTDLKKSPALEALGRIRDAEEDAKAIVREAREKIAAQIIKEAAEAVNGIQQRSAAEAKKEANARKKAILERAIKDAEKIREETQTELAGLQRQAGEVFEEAVQKAELKIREFLRGESA